MLGEMIKKWDRQSFIFHAIISSHYIFGENFISYKNLNTSACLNFNHVTTKKVTYNVKGAGI